MVFSRALGYAAAEYLVFCSCSCFCPLAFPLPPRTRAGNNHPVVVQGTRSIMRISYSLVADVTVTNNTWRWRHLLYYLAEHLLCQHGQGMHACIMYLCNARAKSDSRVEPMVLQVSFTDSVHQGNNGTMS